MKIQNILFLTFIFQIHCVNLNAQTKGDSLIVFVGELLGIDHIPYKDIRTEIRDGDTIEVEIPIHYSIFKSKFRIVKLINGNYSADTIEFITKTEFGTPKYYKSKYSLLFIVGYNTKELSQSYNTFFHVFKTKNGRWASDYSFMDKKYLFTKNFKVTIREIEFEEEPSYDISERRKKYIEEKYPKEYYRYEDEKAIATHGVYIDKLFELKKQGEFKEYFKMQNKN